jgi:hypothetical protein
MTQADMLWSENGFGLGYIDAASGKLTHHFWCSTKAVGEPPGIQLQDFLNQPFKAREITSKSQHESRMSASAYWQARIIDLPGCLEQTRLPGDTVRFNLVLTDSVERFFDEESRWSGAAGDYIVTLGPSSSAEPGRKKGLPILNASINAFTRLWLGVRPARPSGSSRAARYRPSPSHPANGLGLLAAGLLTRAGVCYNGSFQS